MTRSRHAVLSMIPLGMLLLGLAALAAPEPFRGPPVVAQPFPLLPQPVLSLGQPLFLADAVGMILLASSILGIWMMALLWEYRCHACRQGEHVVK